MGKAADEAYERLKAREGNRHEANQYYALERSHIMAEAPALWRQLIAEIDSEVKDFSRKRPDYIDFSGGLDVDGGFASLAAADRKIEIGFSPQRPRITYTIERLVNGVADKHETITQDFSFGVRDGQVCILDGPNVKAIPDIVATLFRHLV